MRTLKDLVVTAAIGVLLSQGLIALIAHLSISRPMREEQRPVLIVGTVLFALLFRFCMDLRRSE